MNPQWLDRTAFVFPMKFCLCTTEKMFFKVLKQINLKKKHVPEEGEWTKSDEHAKVWYFSNAARAEELAVVCLPIDNDHSIAEVHALIVHEATHLMQQAMKLIGEDEPSSEFQAYMMQNICQELFREYERQSKKGKK